MDQWIILPCGYPPAILIHKLLFSTLGIFKGDVKHLAEVLAQVMGSRALDRPAGGRDVGLDGGGVVAAGKLLFLRLSSPHHRNRHHLLVNASVQVQNSHHLQSDRNSMYAAGSMVTIWYLYHYQYVEFD